MAETAIFVPDNVTDLSDVPSVYTPQMFAANHTVRNAIPTSARQEGMQVYCQSDQIIYQLIPRPTGGWTGTDSDWVAFGALQPFIPPAFSSFAIAGVGLILITGASISGSVTFTWTDTQSSNVAANSISITDTTANVVLASGLSDTGSHTLTLPSSVQLNTPGSHVWTIAGTDTKGNAFSLSLTISWIAPSNQTYYIRPDGSDSNNGKADNSGGAWLTFAPCYNATFGAGDTIHVRAGTYTLGLSLGWNTPVSGASGHPISFLGDAGAIINHRNTHTPDGIDVEGCNYITISGFTIINDGSITRAGIRMSGGGQGNVVENNTISGTGQFGILGGFQSNSLVQGNVIHDIKATGGNTTGHGVYWANSLVNATLRLNTIYNCGGNGLHMNGDISQGGTGVASGCLIERNTLYNNQQTYLGGDINCDGLQNSRLQNNLIYACPGAGIALYQVDSSAGASGNVTCNNTVIVNSTVKSAFEINTNSINNTVFNNVVINLATFSAGTTSGAMDIDGSSLAGFVCDHNVYSNLFSFDDGASWVTLTAWQNATAQDAHSTITSSLSPMFTDYPDGDYHYLSTAPQVDEGVGSLNSQNAPSVDLDGTPRPFNSLYDAGSYEYNPNLPGVASHTPTSDSVGVVQTVTVTFTKAVTATSVSLGVQDSNGIPVAGAVTPNSGTATTFTFTPTSRFATSSAYRAFVSGATDVGGDVMAGTVAWNFTTAAAPNLGPFNVFPSAYVPATPAYFDAGGTTLGMRFKSDVAGNVSGVRFYKGATNTGTHVGFLWDDTGVQLATGTFSGESGSGWQTLTFGSPVAIAANTVYVAGYFAPAGHYSTDFNLFASSYDFPPLHAPADNPAGDRNGVTLYGEGYPTQVGGSGVPAGSSYGVDAVFDGRSPGPSTTNVAVNSTIQMTYNVPIANTPTVTVTGTSSGSVAGTLSYNSTTHSFTFTPNANLANNDTFTVSVSGAQDAAGNTQVGTIIWSFVTVAMSVSANIWANNTPTTVDSADASPYTFGLEFTVDTAAHATGVRFYKSTANTGLHTGYLWSWNGSSATLLAQIDFSGETSSGWQLMNFNTSIALSSGQTYVVGVYMPSGHYSDDTSGAHSLVSAYTNGHLTALANGSDFHAGSGGAFSGAGGSNNNYWVDIQISVP